MELRVRRGSDLDACEQLAHVVHTADGYPPRCADDLRGFVSAGDGLGAWVVESEKGIIGHVALLPRSSSAVMAVGAAATRRPPERLCVVARLFVAPTERKAGIGRSLLAVAADAGHARGLWPILDVASHFDNAIRLYERAGWTYAGQVTVDFRGEPPLKELVFIGPDPGSAGESTTADSTVRLCDTSAEGHPRRRILTTPT
ncbi:MAG: GNAT family N-acetyltransferase [Acidimicrobiales bacterium]